MGVSQDATATTAIRPDEEFLDQFQQDLLSGTRRVRRRIQEQTGEVVARRGEWC